MEKKEVYPVIKALDTHHAVSHLYFDEWVELPDGSEAEIILQFDHENSPSEMRQLAAILNNKRLKFIINPKTPTPGK